MEGEGTYECQACNFTTVNRYNWDIHLTTVKHLAKSQGLVCSECGAVYDSKNRLTRHKKNVHIRKETKQQEYLDAMRAKTQSTAPLIKPTITLKFLGSDEARRVDENLKPGSASSTE